MTLVVGVVLVLRQEIRAVGTGSLTPLVQRIPCISQGIALGEAPEASHDMVDGALDASHIASTVANC